jgi:hypothetical protein
MKLALDAWEEIPEGQIHTIPVRLDACEIPERFKPFQWVDLFDERGFERIVNAIRFQQSQHAHHAASHHLSTLAQPAFQEMSPVWKSSSFLNDGELLVKLIPSGNHDKASDIIWHNAAQSFLRLIPTKPTLQRTPFALEKLAREKYLSPFGKTDGMWTGRNKHGAVVFNAEKQTPQTTADSITQLFLKGEIWGVDQFFLRREHEGKRFIPSTAIEEVFEGALKNYLRFAQQALGLELPLRLIAGLAEVENFMMALPDEFLPDKFGGHVVQEEVVYEDIVGDYTTPVNELLLPFFKQVWEACGIERPENFRQETR